MGSKEVNIINSIDVYGKLVFICGNSCTGKTNQAIEIMNTFEFKITYVLNDKGEYNNCSYVDSLADIEIDKHGHKLIVIDNGKLRDVQNDLEFIKLIYRMNDYKLTIIAVADDPDDLNLYIDTYISFGSKLINK